MGVRFRKSIKLGGGFRINISKSGIGYSWGGKGFRVTQKAKGGIRSTVTIPGTGVSFSEEFGGKSRKSPSKRKGKQQPPVEQLQNDNLYDTVDISNGEIEDIVSDGLEDMIEKANKALKMNKIATIGLIASLAVGCWLASIVFLIMKIYVKKKGYIDLDYTIEGEQREEIKRRMAPLHKIAESDKLWRVIESSQVKNTKYTSGAGTSIERVSCDVTSKIPFPFRTNEDVVCFRSQKEWFIFLPDKLFLIKDGKIGALNYADLTTSVKSVRFVESDSVPSDARIVGRTWKYVNASGGPDKRFNDNCEYPVCLYGEFSVCSLEYGVNSLFMFSNSKIEFSEGQEEFPQNNQEEGETPSTQPPTKKKHKGDVVRWIFGGIFSMFALVNGFHYSTVFLIISAFLMFPFGFVREFMSSKNIKFFVAIILSIVFLLAGILTSPPSDSEDGELGEGEEPAVVYNDVQDTTQQAFALQTVEINSNGNELKHD